MHSLPARALLGFAQLTVVLVIVLFLPAGTLDFPEAWVFLCIFIGSAAVISWYLWKKDPDLLERRVKAGPGAEKERSQNIIQVVASIAFVGLLVVPALDHRFSWSSVPVALVIVGDLLVILGFFMVFLVFKENTYTAGTIEVATGQQVISTGPYSVVRHPMYAGALVLLLGTPLALGSWWGLLMWLPMALAISWRLLDEERFLAKNLPGYTEYCQRVRYRLVPSIW